jgi:hypothetical protein
MKEFSGEGMKYLFPMIIILFFLSLIRWQVLRPRNIYNRRTGEWRT